MRSLQLSIRNAVLFAVAAMQSLLLVAVVASGLGPVETALLVVIHVVVAGLSLLTVKDRLPTWLVVVCVYSAAFLDVALANSHFGSLTFTGNWLVLVASALPTVLLRGKRAFAVHALGCIGYSAVVALVHPGWGSTIPEGQVIAGYSIFLGMRAGLAFLGAFAAQVDARAAAAAEAAERVVRARSASQEAAEDARILHDTVINTLAAVAAGGGAVRDGDLVRERCARDAELVEALLDDRFGQRGDAASIIGPRRGGLQVRRHGLDDDAMTRALAELPRHVVEALTWVVHEVVQNAAKHSGADAVDLTVTLAEDRLRVEIVDQGVGFDPTTEARRGLATSVFGRAAHGGIDVDLQSSPGHGVAVTLLLPPAGGGTGQATRSLPDETAGLAAVVTSIRLGAAWLWAIGVLVVGVVLEVTSQPGRWTPTYLALVIGGVAVVIAWTAGLAGSGGSDRADSAGPGFPRWAQAVLVVLLVPAFLLSAATSDFGRVDPVLWQVLSSTGIILLLQVASGSPRAGRWGMGAHLATAVVAAAVVWPDSPTAGLILITGACIAVGVMLGWSHFDRVLGVVAERTADAERILLAARLEEQRRDAVAEARLKWRYAGLQRTLTLLQRIASGVADPQDARVQRACGEEESHLRQLVQLDPDLLRMSIWLVRALDLAREVGVRLVIRTGASEPSTSEDADDLGRLLLDVVDSMQPGDDVVVTIYGNVDGIGVTMVAPRPRLSAACLLAPSGSLLEVRSFGEQDVVQVQVS